MVSLRQTDNPSDHMLYQTHVRLDNNPMLSVAIIFLGIAIEVPTFIQTKD